VWQIVVEWWGRGVGGGGCGGGGGGAGGAGATKSLFGYFAIPYNPRLSGKTFKYTGI